MLNEEEPYSGTPEPQANLNRPPQEPLSFLAVSSARPSKVSSSFRRPRPRNEKRYAQFEDEDDGRRDEDEKDGRCVVQPLSVPCSAHERG